METKQNLKHTIGILGGSFDPVHLGHIHLAKEIYRQLTLDSIYFIPCYKSPHTKNIIATPKQRLEMVQLALEEIDIAENFIADAREIIRKKNSYTIDTLNELRKEFPKNPLCLILGTDAFSQLNTWHKWQDILSFTHIVVADREDAPKLQAPQLIDLIANKTIIDKKLLHTKPSGHIFFLKIQPLPISSTQIREWIKNGNSALVQKSLSKKVWRYISKENIYS